MHQLSERYRIEWAILFSPERQGIDPRYPSLDKIKEFMDSDLHLAAHLCGKYAKAVNNGDVPQIDVDLSRFKRIQINHEKPNVETILQFQDVFGGFCIAQSRGNIFPVDDRIVWLFDRSGGNGITPMIWPNKPVNRVVGYAGGINSDNVINVLKKINSSTSSYWIDMETGVRTDNKFDIKKCEFILDKVYGKPKE